MQILSIPDLNLNTVHQGLLSNLTKYEELCKEECAKLVKKFPNSHKAVNKVEGFKEDFVHFSDCKATKCLYSEGGDSFLYLQ